MANSDGSANSGNVSDQSKNGSGISGGDDIIRIDPGVIDANADGTETPTVSGNGSGRGPNGRKLNKDGTERKAKGSRSGNASTGSAPQASLSIEAVTTDIVISHAIIATFLKFPEFAIEPPEAQVLARALCHLQTFYPNVNIAPKMLAWKNTFSALFLVYGSRIGGLYAKKKADAREAQKPTNVIRPEQFQQARPSVVTPQPAAPNAAPKIMTPDGDDLPGTTPQQASGKISEADRAFSSIPPEMM